MAKILLSFDTEEFDVPREHGVDITLGDAMKISVEGTTRILDTLRDCGVKATFFCTSNFAENAPDIITRILADGHELAAHGCDHWRPQPSDVARSKEILERIGGVKVFGYRQPRMFAVSDSEIARCGYLYNSSLNPAFIPGRYMHLREPRRWFVKDGVVQIPASVTPLMRFPLFWLSCHHLPKSLYRRLAANVAAHDGYFATYFHPWEFVELSEHPDLNLPWLIRRNSGQEMARRLSALIGMFKRRGDEFVTYYGFAKELI